MDGDAGGMKEDREEIGVLNSFDERLGLAFIWPGSARLVRSSPFGGWLRSLAVVAVEIFVKKDKVFSVGISGIVPGPPVAGTLTDCIGKEEAGQSAGKFGRHLVEGHEGAGAGGELDLKVVSVEVGVAFQRFNEEVVDGKPDGPPPVGIAAEEWGVAFSRDIVDLAFGAGMPEVRDGVPEATGKGCCLRRRDPE